MLRLDVAFLPTQRPTDVAVVIDVLRMTTTAATLLSLGLNELIVVADVEEATELAHSSGALLLGERHGVPLPGFHGGNSPTELRSADLGSSGAVMCTTNGSKAVEAASSAKHLLLGAIVNAPMVAQSALDLAQEEVLLVCAGTNGRPSLDDVLGAGCIAQEMVRLAPEVRLSDAALMAVLLAGQPEGLAHTLNRCDHAATLRDLGFGADLEWAARLGSVAAVPVRRTVGPARFSAARTK